MAENQQSRNTKVTLSKSKYIETITKMARSIDVLASVIASVRNDNLSQKASDGSSYWNSPLANILARENI
jgi:hypothetical protein